MTIPNCPLVPGKWYTDRDGKVLMLHSLSSNDGHLFVHMTNGYRLESSEFALWRRWTTSGPHDTREQAEQAEQAKEQDK